MSASSPIAVRALNKSILNHEGTKTSILHNINFDVNAGESVAILGASGSGKTTLLSVIGALDPAYQGSVQVMGLELSALSENARADLRYGHIGFVFQAFHLLEHLSVQDNVAMAFWLNLHIEQRKEEPRERAAHWLSRVGLQHKLRQSVRSLSGGERQRVAIARALVRDPLLILADEPTGNLDAETGHAILEAFFLDRETHKERAWVFATHDKELAARCDRIVHLRAGSVEERP